eukprot:gene13237-9083_t
MIIKQKFSVRSIPMVWRISLPWLTHGSHGSFGVFWLHFIFSSLYLSYFFFKKDHPEEGRRHLYPPVVVQARNVGLKSTIKHSTKKKRIQITSGNINFVLLLFVCFTYIVVLACLAIQLNPSTSTHAEMLKSLLVLSGFQKKWPAVTAEDVRQQPYWIVCGNSVYDIEPILGEHPGGDSCLLRRCRGETDCERDYGYHSRKGKEKWAEYKVGELSKDELLALEELRNCRLTKTHVGRWYRDTCSKEGGSSLIESKLLPLWPSSVFCREVDRGISLAFHMSLLKSKVLTAHRSGRDGSVSFVPPPLFGSLSLFSFPFWFVADIHLDTISDKGDKRRSRSFTTLTSFTFSLTGVTHNVDTEVCRIQGERMKLHHYVGCKEEAPAFVRETEERSTFSDEEVRLCQHHVYTIRVIPLSPLTKPLLLQLIKIQNKQRVEQLTTHEATRDIDCLSLLLYEVECRPRQSSAPLLVLFLVCLCHMPMPPTRLFFLFLDLVFIVFQSRLVSSVRRSLHIGPCAGMEQQGSAMVVADSPTTESGGTRHADGAPPTRTLAPAQVDRIVKAALPDGMLLSREAKVALQKAAAITVLYLGCMAAAERDAPSVKKKGRTTLLPVDIAEGLEAAGFAHLLPQMTTLSASPKRGRDEGSVAGVLLFPTCLREGPVSLALTLVLVEREKKIHYEHLWHLPPCCMLLLLLLNLPFLLSASTFMKYPGLAILEHPSTRAPEKASWMGGGRRVCPAWFQKLKKIGSHSHPLVVFALLHIITLIASATAHGDGLLGLQQLLLLHHIASLAAEKWPVFLRRDALRREYPFSFGLHRLPTLIRFGAIIFFASGCVTQIGEQGHHRFTRVSSEAHHAFSPGDVDELLLDQVDKTHVHSGAFEVWVPVLQLCYTAALFYFRDVVSCSDAIAGSVQVDRNGVGGSRGASVQTRQLTRLFAFPLVVLVSRLVAACTSGHWATDLITVLAVVWYLWQCIHAGRQMSGLLLNKGIDVESSSSRNRVQEVLGQVAVLPGVELVVRHAWWRVHGTHTIMFVQLLVRSETNAGTIAAQCRCMLEESLCTQAFVECSVLPGEQHNELCNSAIETCDSRPFNDPLPLGTYGDINVGEMHECGSHSHSHDIPIQHWVLSFFPIPLADVKTLVQQLALCVPLHEPVRVFRSFSTMTQGQPGSRGSAIFYQALLLSWIRFSDVYIWGRKKKVSNNNNKKKAIFFFDRPMCSLFVFAASFLLQIFSLCTLFIGLATFPADSLALPMQVTTTGCSTSASLEIVTKKSTSRQICIRLEPDQAPLHAQVSAAGLTGVQTSLYDPATHSWVVVHTPVHPGAAVDVTVRLVILRDPQHQYDVHIAAAQLMDAASIESLVQLEKRSLVLQSLDVAHRPSHRTAARSFCPATGCVTVGCSLPHQGPGYQLCGGGFHSEYPVLAAEPAEMPVDQDTIADSSPSTLSALALLPANAPPSSLIGAGGTNKKTAPMRDSKASRGAPPVTLNGWSVTATPHATLSCIAIGVRLKEPSEWGETSPPASALALDFLLNASAASSADLSLSSWLSKTALKVELSGPSSSFRIKLPAILLWKKLVYVFCCCPVMLSLQATADLNVVVMRSCSTDRTGRRIILQRSNVDLWTAYYYFQNFFLCAFPLSHRLFISFFFLYWEPFTFFALQT